LLLWLLYRRLLKIYRSAELLHLLCQGAAVVHFQDFNAEVIRCLTIPNVNANLSGKNKPLATNAKNSGGEVRFFAGDWSEIHKLLPPVQDNENDLHYSSGHSQVAGYDIVLMAETVYSISTLQSLFELIKKVSFLFFFPGLLVADHIFLSF
jgi:hypothetical protein